MPLEHLHPDSAVDITSAVDSDYTIYPLTWVGWKEARHFTQFMLDSADSDGYGHIGNLVYISAGTTNFAKSNILRWYDSDNLHAKSLFYDSDLLAGDSDNSPYNTLLIGSRIGMQSLVRRRPNSVDNSIDLPMEDGVINTVFPGYGSNPVKEDWS